VKFGLFCSVIGTGMLTSTPYTEGLDLKYGPVGNTVFAGRPYCRIKRRRSPKRCAVSHSQRARSANSKLTAPPAAVAELVSSAASAGTGLVSVSVRLNGLGLK